MYPISPKNMSDQELEHELLAPSQAKEQTDSPQPDTSGGGLQRKLDVARELLLRRLTPKLRDQRTMESPAHIREWLQLHCAGLEHEVLLVVYLNIRHQVIDAEPLFRGGLGHSLVSIREVVKAALAHNAAAVIVAHNHPSGSDEPSSNDLELTRTLKAALVTCEITLLDHFLIAGANVVSFAERRWL
ncbi:JAB domain-containing protein [Pseudomonas bubulae]|uniref:JAB domain-containing protein n=1 Tax=Pseudomonas bubulae TaxID=2316085 RepID=UPI002B1E4DDE|nr:JAB domain-containing protein [Pseudomonas bubulae]